MTNEIPKITKNDPLKIEEVKEEYQESRLEKKGKVIFILGVLYALLILTTTWLIFFAWLKLK